MIETKVTTVTSFRALGNVHAPILKWEFMMSRSAEYTPARIKNFQTCIADKEIS
jgi:hypothetical protein